MVLANVREGDEVFVFYRASQKCEPQRQFVAVLDPRHGSQRPRTGLSAGYVPARVASPEQDGELQVEYTWPYFFSERGQMVMPSEKEPWPEWHASSDVFTPAANGSGKEPLPWMPLRQPGPPGWRPELSILAVRWGGLNSIIAPLQWGHTGSSVSDLFVNSFLDLAVVPALGNNYEVWTVYIEDQSDLIKLADTAHLVFGPSHPLRRARHTCAMYFLYPTAFEENCIPTMETGEDNGAGMVDQTSLFRLMRAVERAGIPTRFPHASGLYEQLASKRWTYAMSLAPHLRVPPTVALPRMLVERDCAAAAAKGIAALQDVKVQQARLRGETAAVADVIKGVAKLGFSWEALDVKFWKEQDGLEDALWQLVHAITINEEYTGQPHDIESLILQEYCPHDLELRAYVVEGYVEAVIYTKFCRIKDNSEFGDFEELFTSEEAAAKWMDGDLKALQDGDRQCREVTKHWLVWLEAQASEMPRAIRFDYFVGRAAKGRAFVWTLEICELGFSMLGEPNLPNKVFEAMLRGCLDKPPLERSDPSTTTGYPNADASPPKKGSAKGCAKGATKGGQGSTPKGFKGAAGKSGGKGSSPKGCSTGPLPPALKLTVPTGNVNQKRCTGTYSIVDGMQPGGMPVWKNVKGDRYLYCGTDSQWYVGDTDEFSRKFDCCEGYIRHSCAQHGEWPHKGQGSWERYCMKTSRWVKDTGVVVAPDA